MTSNTESTETRIETRIGGDNYASPATSNTESTETRIETEELKNQRDERGILKYRIHRN